MDLVVVDGPNLVNSVASYLTRRFPSEALDPYLSDWFDLDRLVLSTIGADSSPKLGIVVFHSKKALGRGAWHLDAGRTQRFWGRTGALPNASCVLVDIPGLQSENYPFDCTNCGHKNQATARSEKGVDTTMVSFMFETAPQWDSVCIFSRDADFVPPVLSLRRQGKMVFCSVEHQPTASPLVSACQSNFPLNTRFLDADLALSRALAPAGPLDRLVDHLSEHGVQFVIEMVPPTHRHFMNSDTYISLSFLHAGESDFARLDAAFSRELRELRETGVLREIERRNETLAVAHLCGTNILFRGFARYQEACASAVWMKHLGSIGSLITLQQAQRAERHGNT